MVLTAVVSIRWGAFAIGGSDSHCYAGQARMFVEGRVSLAPPLALPVPWPNAAATFAPSGFAPGPDPAGGSVPLCAAGLAVAMAAAMRIAGDAAIFAVVPLMGLLAVWSTWLLGRRVAGPLVGAASAALVACSPIFLYQLVQPMSDVPAAALWTAAIATALGPPGAKRPGIGRGLAAGLITGAAIMMRPNLAPLAIIPMLLAWPSRTAAIAAAGGAVPGIVAVALLQAAIYGSPLRSGYGDLGQLFSLGYVKTNIVNYPAWLAYAHTPVLALGVLAPFVAPRRGVAWALLAFCRRRRRGLSAVRHVHRLVVHALPAPGGAGARRADDDRVGTCREPAAQASRDCRPARADGCTGRLLAQARGRGVGLPLEGARAEVRRTRPAGLVAAAR